MDSRHSRDEAAFDASVRERTVSSKRLYEGRVISVRLDEIELDGRRYTREVVEHKGAAVIIARPSKDTIVLVRQRRHPVNGFLWEIPAGTLEANENPEDAARRELAEETGYRAGSIRGIWSAYSAPGFCSEMLHFFEATELQAGAAHPDEGEELLVRSFGLDDLAEMVYAGALPDAKTQIAVLWALAQRKPVEPK